jgi:hypothetical protein
VWLHVSLHLFRYIYPPCLCSPPLNAARISPTRARCTSCCGVTGGEKIWSAIRGFEMGRHIWFFSARTILVRCQHGDYIPRMAE